MDNNRVIIGGGGYSVREGIELGLFSKIKREEIWSCNYFYRAMPYFPTKQFWVDVSFYRNNTEEMQRLWQNGVSIVCKHHPTFAGISDYITMIPATRQKENYFGTEALKHNFLYSGGMGLVGMFALSYAIATGKKEIYLLGFDFGSTNITDKNTHFYQNELNVYSTGVKHPEVYRLPNNNLKKEISDFDVYLKEKDIRIFNVSTKSNIHQFPKISYNEFFNSIGISCE